MVPQTIAMMSGRSMGASPLNFMDRSSEPDCAPTPRDDLVALAHAPEFDATLDPDGKVTVPEAIRASLDLGPARTCDSCSTTTVQWAHQAPSGGAFQPSTPTTSSPFA